MILGSMCLLECNMALNAWLSVLVKNEGIIVLSMHNCVLQVNRHAFFSLVNIFHNFFIFMPTY